MLEIGRGMGKQVAALVTDMSQPLGRTIGNSLEVIEAIETLKGRGPKDLESLSIELAAWMLSLSGPDNLEQSRAKVRAAVTSGAGLRKLQQLIERQGGDPRVGDDPALLPRARETFVLKAAQDARVGGITCRAIGEAAMRLGAGRDTLESAIDPAVGIVVHKKCGELVIEGEPLLTVHYNDRGRLERAMPLLEKAVRLAPEAPAPVPLIRDVLHG
jgi:thymidine phosphorylase